MRHEKIIAEQKKMQKEVKQRIKHMLINANIRLERMSHPNKKLSYISG